MGLNKKTKGHDVVIKTASAMYDESIRMFVEAEKKIDEANEKLDATIEEIDAAIAELQAFRAEASTDKERNTAFKLKLHDFTA